MTVAELRATYRGWAIGQGRTGYVAIRKDNVFISEADETPPAFSLVAEDLADLTAQLAEQRRIDARSN